ncbi:hypothetical protein N9K47_00250 [bacterium]|nr:hypothetical protein [bacterium]
MVAAISELICLLTVTAAQCDGSKNAPAVTHCRRSVEAGCVAALTEVINFLTDLHFVRAATGITRHGPKVSSVAAIIESVEHLLFSAPALLANFFIAVETRLVTALP